MVYVMYVFPTCPLALTWPLPFLPLHFSPYILPLNNYHCIKLFNLSGTHRFRMYDACFIGREAVDFLLSRPDLSQATTRREAVAVGRRLLKHDFIRHVVHSHDFKDG